MTIIFLFTFWSAGAPNCCAALEHFATRKQCEARAAEFRRDGTVNCQPIVVERKQGGKR